MGRRRPLVVAVVVLAASSCATSIGTTEASITRPQLGQDDGDRPIPPALSWAETDQGSSDVSPVRAAVLRTDLQGLMTRYSEAMTLHTRDVLDGTPTASGSAELRASTEDLSAMFEQLRGGDAAGAFDELWTGHLEIVEAYTDGILANDSVQMVSAVERSRVFEHAFANFVATLTDGHAPHDEVHTAVRSHVAALFEQADAWAAGAHRVAFARAADAHQHIDTVAAMLANGVAAARPSDFVGTVFDDVSADCAAHQLEQSLALSARFDLARAESSSDPGERVAASVMYESRTQAASVETLRALDVHETAIARADTNRLSELHHTIRREVLDEIGTIEHCLHASTR